MKRHRILQVIRPSQGGIRKHLLELSDGLRARGWDQLIACSTGEMAQWFRREGFAVREIGLGNSLGTRDAACLIQLIRLIRHHRPQIMHLHGAKAGLVGRLAGHLTAVPVVLYTAHNSVFYEAWPAWKRRLAAAVEYALSFYTDRTITVSDALRKELAGTGIAPERLYTIHNGIRFFPYTGSERLRMREELGLGTGQAVVGCVARFAPQKGLRDLVEAAGLLNPELQAHLLLVGSGPLETELREHARRLAVPATFTGYRQDVPELLAAMDVFVLPSVTEGLPLTVLEALAAGLPVIATRVGGLPEVILDGVCGRLVPPRSPGRMARAIEEVLAHPEVGKGWGAAGAKRVKEAFSQWRMVNETTTLYRELCARKGLLQ